MNFRYEFIMSFLLKSEIWNRILGGSEQICTLRVTRACMTFYHDLYCNHHEVYCNGGEIERKLWKKSRKPKTKRNGKKEKEEKIKGNHTNKRFISNFIVWVMTYDIWWFNQNWFKNCHCFKTHKKWHFFCALCNSLFLSPSFFIPFYAFVSIFCGLRNRCRNFKSRGKVEVNIRITTI